MRYQYKFNQDNDKKVRGLQEPVIFFGIEISANTCSNSSHLGC